MGSESVLLEAEGVLTPSGHIQEGGLLIANGRVEAVGRARDLAPRAAEIQRVDGTLLPGAIDLQVNGAGGRGVEEATPESLDAIAETVLAGGASAFLPTLISAPFELLLERVERVARWIPQAGERGALPLGLHVEGPFLEVPGAHPPQDLIDPTPERVEALLEAAQGRLRLVTLACDRPGAVQAVQRFVQAGVSVAIGHAQSATQLQACVDAGARLATHLFNAMGRLHHREVGLAQRVMDDARLTACLIPDLLHVHPIALRQAWRSLGPERTILVTDCMAAAGMPDGEYDLSGSSVILREGEVRDANGHLAGSAILMKDALQRFRDAVPEVDEGTLARCSAIHPARCLGLEPSPLVPGAPARFTVLHPTSTHALRLDT